jgi:hypothetical protein
MNDLTNPVFFITLSWCRFLAYNDNIQDLKKKVVDFQNKKEMVKPPLWIELCKEEDMFVIPVSLENENRAWMRLHSEIIVAISIYKTI